MYLFWSIAFMGVPWPKNTAGIGRTGVTPTSLALVAISPLALARALQSATLKWLTNLKSGLSWARLDRGWKPGYRPGFGPQDDAKHQAPLMGGAGIER